MEFIKGYMDDAHHRHLLNDMTQEIFGFSFEDWYSSGYFEGEYIPYSYKENGEIVANASANIMKMLQNGNQKYYIQIGTVMTRSSYRNRGLARELIQRILSDYKEYTDGFYLYGNLNATGFYEKLGFCRLDQHQYSSNYCPVVENKGIFLKAGESDKERYLNALKNAAINPVLDQINRYSLQLFYTGRLENVYYCSELDCFAVMYIENETLHLNSIISEDVVSVKEVLECVAEPYQKIILGFTPREEERKSFQVTQFDGGKDYRFFYLGVSLEEIAEDKLYFPIMSHA